MSSTKTTFAVPAMRCGGCANNIRSILSRRGGVHAVSADPVTKEVAVEYDARQTTADAIADVLATAGYPVAGTKEAQI